MMKSRSKLKNTLRQMTMKTKPYKIYGMQQKQFLEVHSNTDSLQETRKILDFPGGTVVKNPPANAGDTGSSPGPGRSHMPRSN